MKLITKLATLTPFIAIIILAILPVFYTWGRLPVFGDTMIPFNSAGMGKYLYQWLPLQNGQYFAINYIPYLLFFKFVELFTYNIYFISAVILFLLKVIAGLGIYKLSKLLYAKERALFYTLPVVFYLLSPAQLSGSIYLYIYSFAPWFFYFVFKVIKHNKIKIQDLLWLSVLLFFSSINLPNPKYVFHLFVISIIIFILGFILKFINIRFLYKNFGKIIIFFLLSAYLILPQVVFVRYFSPQDYGIHIKEGYKDEGRMMDFGEAAIQRMLKLHKDSINLNKNAKDQYNSNPLINILSYAFVILIIANVFFIKNIGNDRKKYQYLLLILIIVYLFFAAGPNPPLGFLYQRMVESFSLFGFLRTTAGATFFLSIFYALLLFPVVLNQKVRRQNLVFVFLLIAFCVVGYPLLNGEIYKNVKIVSPNTDITKHGIIIPKDYFDIQEQLNLIKTDVKTLYPTESYSYITTNWGFFGAPFYNFIYNTNNVDCIYIKNSLPYYNVGFVFMDKSSLYPRDCPLPVGKEDVIKETDNIKLSKIPDDLFLPHFYILRDTAQTAPRITFVKINSTKYRIKVENAEEPYTLVFSENFHKAWKLYFNDRPIDDQQYGETVASYFDGDIKEGTHRNSFLDRNILENWFKKPTSETNHLLANGYANSWRITPQDTDGKEKYELIVEFKPQQFFYLGLLISTMTLFGCCLYLLWLVIKKKWKKN